MGKVIKLALMGTAVALFAWGCSKEKPETDPQPQTAPEAPADSTLNLDALVADTLSADSLARLEAERLEAERARLEELINRIMLEDVYFDYDRSELTGQLPATICLSVISIRRIRQWRTATTRIAHESGISVRLFGEERYRGLLSRSS